MGGIYVGTSGWSYKQWEKKFYPARIPVRRHFDFYATQFPTVEINLTFYRLPTPEMVDGWCRKAPHGFLYALKGSRFITHMKKLAGVGEALDRYFKRIEPLRRKTACVLWQLPPILKIDLPRLSRFLGLLPGSYQHAVEFRHPSWLEDTTFDLLRSRHVAFASVSSLAMPQCFQVTSDLTYIRLHGLEGGAAHNYTRKELQQWAAHARQSARKGNTVLVYFNNDRNVRAPENARIFMEMTNALPARAAPDQAELLAPDPDFLIGMSLFA